MIDYYFIINLKKLNYIITHIKYTPIKVRKIDTYSFINLKKNKSMRTHMLILTNNEKLTLHI